MNKWELLVLGAAVGFGLGVIVLMLFNRPTTIATKYIATQKNLESWEIERDEKGRTKGIKVHRTAESV